MWNRRISFRKSQNSDTRRDEEASQGPSNGQEQIAPDGAPPHNQGDRASIPDAPRNFHSMRHWQRLTSSLSSSLQPWNWKGSESNTADPLGLHVIHRPEGERKVDIVFVHGLGGTSRLTWSKNKDLDLFWPHKFLPLEPHIVNARISTFGYDASFRPGSSKNVNTILDFAKDLLFQMKYVKDELNHEVGDIGMGQRPIIFVVHSMGGLIVKEAYMQALHDVNYESMAASVSAIIFLSTPHRGTNLAETLNRILQASFVSAPKRFVSELIKDSYTMQKLNEQFRHVANKLDIVSFYETRTAPVGFNMHRIMILEKDSSVLGYPGEISKPLDADHHGMCKYESRQDPLYITVRNVLTSLVAKLTASSEPETTAKSEGQHNVEVRMSVIKSFLTVREPPDNDYIFFRDRWTPGTCGWILEDASFTKWREDTGSHARLLWIYGTAASGKSVLSSFIIDHLIRNQKQCQYFFIRFGDQSKRSLHHLLRSIAYQVARDVPAYGARLMKLASDSSANLGTAEVRNIWQLLFRTGLCATQLQTPLYWVLDGIDESDSPQTMVKLLGDFASYPIPVRLLLVSRKTQELSSAFQKLGKEIKTDFIQTEGRRSDLQHFIDKEMEDVAGNEAYKSWLTSLILERAQGNFLWVHLAVQRINKCISRKDVEDAIEYLPPGMTALYDRMASAIASQPNETARVLAHDVVAWTACARRLMTITELSAALGRDAPLHLQRSIGDLCGGFVVVGVEGNVAMIHQTTREYLFSTANRFFVIKKQSANELLFRRCMQCLMDASLRGKINRDKEPDLLDYAMSSWFIHLCLVNPTSSAVLSTLVSFLQTQHVLVWMHAVAKSGRLHLLVLCSQYLTSFLAKRNDAERYTTSSQGPWPEDYAVIESWACDLVKIVSRFGRNMVINPQAIYRLIPAFCPHESITYRQFGKKESKSLSVSGLATQIWGDCLGRLSLEDGSYSSSVQTGGHHIVILSLAGRRSKVTIYQSTTFEEFRQIIHPERVLRMHLNASGTLLATYGYFTTKIWDVTTGDCLRSVTNPSDRPWPHAFLFLNNDSTLLVGCNDKRLRFLPWGGLADPSCSGDSGCQWEISASFEEEQREGMIANSPTCIALSPEGDQIAFGYRGHPVTLWEVHGPTRTAECARALDPASSSCFPTAAAQSWGEVTQLRWHPSSEEIFGLYLEGVVFKWQPFDNVVKEVMTGANKLALSRSGSLCATGDANGTIKVFGTAQFDLLYQLTSEDPILDLSFSTDDKRLYDVRGTYANMWEPNTLVHLANNFELLDRSTDTSDSDPLVRTFASPEYSSEKVDGVTVIGVQSPGRLYCYGTEDGAVILCEVGKGKVEELQKANSYMSIEHIAWSEDGRLLATVDIGGKLIVWSATATTTGLVRSSPEGRRWIANVLVETHVAVERGGIKQLLFRPRGDELLIYTTNKLLALSIPNPKAIRESPLVDNTHTLKWMQHPSLPSHLLGFGPESLHIHSWDTLEETNLIPFPSEPLPAVASPEPLFRNNWGKREATVTPTVTADKTQILIQISHIPLSGSQNHLRHLLLPVDAIGTVPSSCPLQTDPVGHAAEPPPCVPIEIPPALRVPLLFLPQGKLVFFDEDYWLCTWQLPTRRGSAPSSAGASTSTGRCPGVKRHYLLPADWISFERAALCRVMGDGSLLYPRNGEVALVQCASLRSGVI